MKKLLLLICFSLYCKSAQVQPVEQPRETPPEVAIHTPDGNTVTMTYQEFSNVRALADRYVALQRRLNSVPTTIEKLERNRYRITIVLDDRTKITLTLRTDD